MYNFIDVTQVSESNVLPSEALCLNGQYIENLVKGYRTLSVSGREALSSELDTYETGVRDGARLKSRRYPARHIIVKYQLIAESNEAFREAYNQLGQILDVTDAEMIFNDEQDKFFIGTPVTIGEVEPGSNSVVGEIEFICNDPFKYSVYEYEAESSLDENSVLLNYNGTYKAYPKLVAEFYDESENGVDETTLTGDGDCGFVAFFTEDEKIIQLGNPDEADGSNAFAKSQTLINQTFLSDTSWGTTAKSLWAVNNGGVLTDSTIVQAGGVAMGAASYTEGEMESTSGTLLKVKTSKGSPLITYAVTAKTSERTANSVKVAVAINTSLVGSSSGIGKNRVIRASLYIGGAWHSVILKKTTDFWSKNQSYTSNLVVTVSGLNADTTSLTGIKFKAERADSLGQAGILAETNCNNLAISKYVAKEIDSYFLFCNNHGDPSVGKWHGASISRNVGADASGAVGAKDFTFTWKQKMCIGNYSGSTRELGGFQAHLTDANGGYVAGVRICKNSTGTTAKIQFYLNGVIAYGTERDLSYNNEFFGHHKNAVQTSSITKTGSTIVFNIGGIKKTFTDDTLKDRVVTKVGFMFERCLDYKILTYNGLYSAKFVKNNCTTWKDVPNKFSANDIVVADCNTGEIFLNGASAPELGALGNDWEGFVLTPGLNQIGFAYSDWVVKGYEPTIKVKYREVFL